MHMGDMGMCVWVKALHITIEQWISRTSSFDLYTFDNATINHVRKEQWFV